MMQQEKGMETGLFAYGNSYCLCLRLLEERIIALKH